MAEDAGREDMFVDCPDEITPDTPPQKMVEKYYVHNTEFKEPSNETETQSLKAETEEFKEPSNETETQSLKAETEEFKEPSNETETQSLKAETEDLQTSIAAEDNFTQEYEEERAVLVRELAHLRNQLKSLNEDQSSVNTNDNVLVKDHQTNSDLASTASLREMISDCCNFLKDAMYERSHTETRIRELDRLLHMKDHEIEVLNTKATEFSVLKDVALSHLNSEQEDSLRMSEVQHETEQKVGEIANGILASLAMLAHQEELPDESVLGKMSHVQKQIDILVEKHKFFLSQIDQVRCCLAEVVPDLTVQDEMGIFVVAREKLIELKTAVNLSQSLSHLGDENRNLMEELDKHKAMLENANSEIVKLNVEAEQEKTRYTNTKEKLSLAVTKGKALVQQRDALKQSLAEKTSELDKCLVELQEKSNALEAAEQTKELLVRSNELATSLQDALSEKDSILQKCGEILSETYGEQLPLTDISENVRWLADERNSLKGIYLEFQKFTETLSSFDFPETVQSSAIDARLSWLLESLYLAKEETGKLQEEMAASKEAANNKIDQLMTSLLMETQEKNYLHGKLQEELAAAREAANSVIESLTTSLLVETQEKSYFQEELGNLTHDYEEIVQKEHYMSLEKDRFVNMLLVAAGIKLDDLELVCHQQSDTSVIIEKCLAKIKEEGHSFRSSHIELESFQKLQSALYTRDLELKMYEPILAEEMLNKTELKHMSSELVVATKELNAVKEERNSLQKNLEQYEEKVALLKEKLSMAVKKGKGIVQERENLKRTLDDKNAEIERLRSELQQQLSIYRDCKDQIDKLSADVDLFPKLEADLVSIKDQRDQLEHFLVESNSILQKVMETIDSIGLPAVSDFEGPMEKVKSLVGCFGESEKAKIEAEQELATVKDEANTLLSKLFEAQTTIKSLQDSLSVAEISISQLQEEKKEQESSKILVEEELQRTIDALSITESSISQLQKDKNELESARILLEQELQKVVGEASTQTSQFAEVCASQKSLEDALSLAENNILVLKNEKEEALLSRDATQKELQKLKEEYSVDKGKLSEANDTIRSFEDALGRARENISLVTEENSKTQIGITHLENEIRNLKEEVESKNSKLADASITIKSLKDALLSAETEVSDLVNEKKNAEQEISELNVKLSNCLQELAGSRGSIETKDLELLGHVKSLQLLLKDENLLYVAWRSFEKKFESLKEFNVHLKEIEDWFPEVHFKMLQGHSLLKDDSSMTTALLTGLDDVPDIEMANGELNALDDESIKFQISKTVKAFHHRNKILTERFEGYSTLIGDLITLVQKLITSLKQKTEDMDTDRQALDNKIDMMEGNLKVLFSACIDATRELNLGLQNDFSEASSNFYLEKLDDSMISDNFGDDDSARLPVFDHSNFEKAAEKLLVAARLCQNLKKQFQDANNEMVETTKDLQNKLKETSIACEGALEERELNRNRISQLENDLDNAQKLCSELRLKLEDHQAREDRLKETEAELSALKKAEDYLLSASQMKSLFEKVNKIEMPLGGAEVGNQEIHESDDLRKLFYVIDSFTGLQNQLDLLSHDKKELQSTLGKQNFEIEHLNEEMKKVKTYEKDCKKMKDELLELTRGLENVIQKLGGNNLVGAQKVAGVSGLLPILEKLVVALIFESENLKSEKEKLGAQLLEMQKVVDELSGKVKSLEGSNQVEVIPGEINQKRDVFEVASLPSESEISEIQDMGPTSNNSASTSVPSAAHARTLRKGSTDHLALTIDSGSERLLNDDEANEDKGHLFKSLVTTGLVPRQGRMLADRIDGIWVSSSRALMSRPQARIGLVVYSLLLHIWLLGAIL
ncbi:PREDICTED: myosin-11 isoform X2 [Ipomoea nil]|uniref:myosin-11 isoform X2 n=1 Tax=Ipomoea nil TaxID=35883 RepID=UPI000901A93D|nr:PREDICTED: myosin-11 isoform X2 [Ipomoea nil]